MSFYSASYHIRRRDELRSKYSGRLLCHGSAVKTTEQWAYKLMITFDTMCGRIERYKRKQITAQQLFATRGMRIK